jgi:hypothetical protein
MLSSHKECLSLFSAVTIIAIAHSVLSHSSELNQITAEIKQKYVWEK